MRIPFTAGNTIPGASLGFEPVYPYWFPPMWNETDQSGRRPPPKRTRRSLAQQVNNLATEVELMREDQALRDSRGAPLPNLPWRRKKASSTLLVYRDGHQIEVQDYAILGKTLWVFSDQRARQVPLADLDLAATERVNGDRGVDFVAPGPQ